MGNPQVELATPYGAQQRARRLEHIHRRGLDESLQQFAERIGGPGVEPENYRLSWALQGLRFLDVVPDYLSWEDLLPFVGKGARIAPGIPVPTKAPKL